MCGVNPEGINFGSSKRELRVTKGSSYWESTVFPDFFVIGPDGLSQESPEKGVWPAHIISSSVLRTCTLTFTECLFSHGDMIKYLLTELGLVRWEKYFALGHDAQTVLSLSVSHKLEPNIFLSGPPFQSISGKIIVIVKFSALLNMQLKPWSLELNPVFAA